MDRQSFVEKTVDANSGKQRKKSHFRFRYLLLAVSFLLAMILILLRTSLLIVRSEQQNTGIDETRGNANSYRLPAVRGDIIDVDGIPLAYSVSEPLLYLTDSKLQGRELNSMLLDFFHLLRNNNIQLAKGLEEYFASDADDPLTYTGKFIFKQETEEIVKWQQKKDLFDLKSLESKADDKDKVKLDPQVFYDYLIFDKFKIEDKDTSDRFFTPEEDYYILLMRYLILKENWHFIQGKPILLGGPINTQVRSIITEQNQRYRGALIIENSQRRYSDDAALFAHAVGYTGRINDSELQEMGNKDYTIDDTIGKTGIEYIAEPYLHGKSGSIPYSIWRQQEDKQTSALSDSFVEASGGIPVKNGARVRLTLSKKMQEVTRNALLESEKFHHDNKLGNATALGAVMIDVKTGAVIAMDSIPSYNPQDFALAGNNPESARKVESYLNDKINKPLLNRCISEIYTPGSTFKPFTSVAAIEKNVISPNSSTYVCNGTEEIAEIEWSCFEKPVEGHGPIDLTEALVTSCNIYFYKLGLDTGIDQISSIAKRFGLGEYTGIDLPYEVKGFVASRKLKQLTRDKEEDKIWFPADTCQTSIGQFDNAFTLLQLARATAGVATNQLVVPHVIKDIVSPEGKVIRPENIVVEPLGFKDESISMVRQGMRNLKNYGGFNTQYYFQNYSVDVSVKTGSAEVINTTGDGLMVNAMYVSYAPTDDPQVAIAIMVQDATVGDYLAPIARRMYDGYFNTDPIAPLNLYAPPISGE